MSVALSRRGVIAGGIAIGVLPLAAGLAAPASHPFLYDAALDPDGRLRVEARRLGLRPVPIADLGRIAHEFDIGGRARLIGIAGVTAPATFFVVEQLARRRGLALRERHGPWWAFGAVGPASEGRGS